MTATEWDCCLSTRQTLVWFCIGSKVELWGGLSSEIVEVLEQRSTNSLSEKKKQQLVMSPWLNPSAIAISHSCINNIFTTVSMLFKSIWQCVLVTVKKYCSWSNPTTQAPISIKSLIYLEEQKKKPHDVTPFQNQLLAESPC